MQHHQTQDNLVGHHFTFTDDHMAATWTWDIIRFVFALCVNLVVYARQSESVKINGIDLNWFQNRIRIHINYRHTLKLQNHEAPGSLCSKQLLYYKNASTHTSCSKAVTMYMLSNAVVTWVSLILTKLHDTKCPGSKLPPYVKQVLSVEIEGQQILAEKHFDH